MALNCKKLLDLAMDCWKLLNLMDSWKLLNPGYGLLKII